jgi:hypothetical protein
MSITIVIFGPKAGDADVGEERVRLTFAGARADRLLYESDYFSRCVETLHETTGRMKEKRTQNSS